MYLEVGERLAGVHLCKSHHQRRDEIPYLGRFASHVFWKGLERGSTCRCQRGHIGVKHQPHCCAAFASCSNIMSFCDILSVNEFLSCFRLVLTRIAILVMWIRHGELYVSNLGEYICSLVSQCFSESGCRLTFYSLRGPNIPFGTSNPTKKNLQNKHDCILLSTSIKI
jgi:hypothetical protein